MAERMPVVLGGFVSRTPGGVYIVEAQRPLQATEPVPVRGVCRLIRFGGDSLKRTGARLAHLGDQCHCCHRVPENDYLSVVVDQRCHPASAIVCDACIGGYGAVAQKIFFGRGRSSIVSVTGMGHLFIDLMPFGNPHRTGYVEYHQPDAAALAEGVVAGTTPPGVLADWCDENRPDEGEFSDAMGSILRWGE